MKLKLSLLVFASVLSMRADTITTYGIGYIDNDSDNEMRYTYQAVALNDPLSPNSSASVSVPMSDITYCHPGGYVQCGNIAITPLDLNGLTDTYDIAFALESWDGEQASWTSIDFPVTGTWSADGLDFSAQYTSQNGSIWGSFTASDPVVGVPEPSALFLLPFLAGLGLLRRFKS